MNGLIKISYDIVLGCIIILNKHTITNVSSVNEK